MLPYRPRMLWPMQFSLPAMTVICSESSIRRKRRPKLNSQRGMSKGQQWGGSVENQKRDWWHPTQWGAWGIQVNTAKNNFFGTLHLISQMLARFPHFRPLSSGKSLPSVCRMLNNPLRRWTPSVPLWKRPNRDCRELETLTKRERETLTKWEGCG